MTQQVAPPASPATGDAPAAFPYDPADFWDEMFEAPGSVRPQRDSQILAVRRHVRQVLLHHVQVTHHRWRVQLLDTGG